ncbi:MAG: 1-phosphofructokinase [Syntrophus sp. (in: bacteria)]|nr:1-phosphofructokinase [Syntrophus sp. (in: bacteria)]
MIYTVTLNPVLDRIIDVEELIYDDVNRVIEEKGRAAGKGIDVSRTIKELGGESVVLGFAGGYSGLELEGGLIHEGVICNFTAISVSTRMNITIYQRKKKLQTLLSTLSPEVGPLEIISFFNKIKEIQKGSYVLISGSTPMGVNENFFAQLITTLKEKGVKVALDADEEVLRRGVNAGPYLIKPNIHEFGRLVGKSVSEVEEIVEYSKPYQEFVEYIVVSMGARGVVGISNQGSYYVMPPKVKVRSSMGAGDSLIAGILFILSNGGSFEDALHMGVACGTASTLNPGTNLCVSEDVDSIKKDVIVKKF